MDQHDSSILLPSEEWISAFSKKMSNDSFYYLFSMPHSKNNIVFLFVITILDEFAYQVLLCHCLQRVKLIKKMENKKKQRKKETEHMTATEQCC